MPTTNINIETDNHVNINVKTQPQKPKSTRFRFSVPELDNDVITWINTQSHLSNSLRRIIRESINTDGFMDVTCRPERTAPCNGYPKKYRYLVITDGNKQCYGSNSRKSEDHIIDDNATECHVYDQNGVLISVSITDESGIVCKRTDNLPKTQNHKYAKMWKQLNAGRKW